MKLFALCKEETSSVSKMLMRIVGTFDGVLQEGENFTCYPTLKAMLPSFAKALGDGDNVVLALDKEQYNAVRQKLSAALSLKTEENAELAEKLAKMDSLSEAEKKAHAAMPKDATVFMTKDGMYSGFVAEKGKQSIFFFPLDEQKLKTILKHGVVPFLTEKAMHKEEPKAAKPAAEEKVLPETPVAEEQTTETTDVQNATELETQAAFDKDDVLQRAINVLREQGQKVAVSGTPGSEPLQKLLSENAAAAEFFTFTPHVEDKGEYNLTDYAALLAKSAKELNGSTYGASISEIGTSDGGDFICITVADDQTALVRKLYREEGETAESFQRDAAEELLELIFDKAAGKGAVGIEISNAQPPEKPSFFKTTGGKVLIAVLCILVAAAVTVGSIFLVQERKRRAEEEIASHTVTPPAESTTAEIKPPVVETVPFSALMKRELLEGITETPASVSEQDKEGAAIDTSGTGNAQTSDIPKEIIVNGITMDAKEAVARIVEAEMGGTYREEALKAQAVCVYTYLKYRNTNWKITGVTLAETASDEAMNAVRAVFGEYLAFENKPAFTPYFKLSAGKTASAESVYKKALPYLRSVDSISDKTNDAYRNELTFAADDVKLMISTYDAKLTVPEEPKEWIKVTKHNGAVNTGVGYVETISICGKEISGAEFVEKVFKDKNLPSTCFEVVYNTPTNEFTVISYGIGDGVGMSQAGADKMAATGSTYVQILAKFFPGTALTA